MRYSKQRELVLRKVEELCDHPTAEEIFDKAAPECPGLSLGTVYRNLYCNACGSVVDADVDEKQVMKLVRSQKGVVQDCAVVLFGLCEACAKKQAEASV